MNRRMWHAPDPQLTIDLVIHHQNTGRRFKVQELGMLHAFNWHAPFVQLINLLWLHYSFLLHLLSTACDKYPNHAITSFKQYNSNILFFSFLHLFFLKVSAFFFLLSFPTIILWYEAHSLPPTIHFCFGVNHHHCIRSWSSSRPLCRWSCLRYSFSIKDVNFHAHLHFPT